MYIFQYLITFYTETFLEILLNEVSFNNILRYLVYVIKLLSKWIVLHCIAIFILLKLLDQVKHIPFFIYACHLHYTHK